MQSVYLKKIKIPDKPGVYFFKKGNTVLYIGKATSLRDRVQSYMSKRLFDMRGPLVEKMTEEANKIDWRISDSVLEALILEAELIKKYQPYYNTKEKDDKSFNYIIITKDKIPKVLIVRGKNLQNYKGFSFGPYTNSAQLKIALQIIRKIFPFIDEASSKKANMEFYRQIHLTPDNMEEYIRNIKNLKLFLHGKKKDILRSLKKDMFALAKARKFEQADMVKRQLFALQHINDIALLKNGSSFIFSPLRPSPLGRDPRGFKNEKTSVFRIEAYDIAHMGGENMVGAMVVVKNGEIEKSEYKKFRIKTQTSINDTGALKEVLERRLAHSEWTLPDLIVVDGGVAQLNVVKVLLSKAGFDIKIVSVVKNERHKPKAILGREDLIKRYKKDILLANSEAHRFAIAYHKKMRNRNFLP